MTGSGRREVNRFHYDSIPYVAYRGKRYIAKSDEDMKTRTPTCWRSSQPVPPPRVPAELTKNLDRYEVAVFRLGRLAVDRSVQGQRLGGDLLLAAGIRALSVAAEVGGVALAIDAKDARAAWYERFGAMQLLDDRLKLILPLNLIAQVIAVAQRKN